MEDYNKISKQLAEQYPMFTDFELLSLSIQIERNQILQNGLNVSNSNKHPASLEAIAIALGFSDKEHEYTITDAIMQIANKDDL